MAVGEPRPGEPGPAPGPPWNPRGTKVEPAGRLPLRLASSPLLSSQAAAGGGARRCRAAGGRRFLSQPFRRRHARPGPARTCPALPCPAPLSPRRARLGAPFPRCRGWAGTGGEVRGVGEIPSRGSKSRGGREGVHGESGAPPAEVAPLEPGAGAGAGPLGLWRGCASRRAVGSGNAEPGGGCWPRGGRQSPGRPRPGPVPCVLPPLPPPASVDAAIRRARAVNPDLPTGVRGEHKLCSRPGAFSFYERATFD